jgi:predicted lipase
MYNFGSPRVGNRFFAILYNHLVPDSFRTVIDGDVVTSMPPTRYQHVGTQALVSLLGLGFRDRVRINVRLRVRVRG